MNKLNLILRFRKVHRTTLLAIFSGSLLVGLGLVQAGWRLHSALWLMAVGIVLFMAVRKRFVIAVPAVILAGLALGLWRGSALQTELNAYGDYIGTKVTLRGTVIDDAVYGDKGQRDMRLRDVQINSRSPPGIVRVTSFTFSQPRRGDVVEVKGKLYDGFGNYQAAVYFGDLAVVSVARDPLDDMRRTFAAGVYSNMPDVQASLGLGVLMGIKAQLPPELDDQLQILALTHIVVASGYNLTVLARLARRLFEKRSKFQTAVAAGGLMAGFVVVTGFSPSMSRAALVGGLSLAAWYYGRHVHPAVLLLVAAAITAMINPVYLWSDLGWWLSFLAFAGVLLLAPLIEHCLCGERRPKFIGQIVIETCAAQILTLPLTLAIFGKLSILGLVANILIVPLIPLAMLLTLIAGIAAAIGPFAAYVALPAAWLLTYITQIVELLAGVPWAATDVKISMVGMVGFYVVLTIIGVLMWCKTRHDFMARSVID